MNVEVVNMRKCPDFGKLEGDVLIDRTTKWGNPYFITNGCTRSQCIKKYEKYFVENLLCDINELQGARRLGCHCAPLACHGGVIKKYLDSHQTQLQR
jgi:hypothetical protein